MFVGPQEISILRDFSGKSRNDPDPVMREIYRQLVIEKAKEIGVHLTPDHFPAFHRETPGNTDKNATETAGNEKPDVPNALPEYPGECPICGVPIKSNLAWLGHKKVHH